jgi:hypothetical protein
MTVATIVLSSKRSCAMSTFATKSSPNRSWLALESICTLLATTKVTALVLELIHANSWELGSCVVLGLVLVNLVDRNGGVNDGWLNSLLLNDRLDVLVDVMVNVLASNGGSGRCRMLNVTNLPSVLELGGLGSKTLFYVIIISVLNIAMLDTSHLMSVLLWEDLAILHRLDRGMVMVLVNLTINGCLLLIELGSGYMFVGNGWIDGLAAC